jgi:hypothetical protein
MILIPSARSPRVLSRGIAMAERDAASRALPCTQLSGGSGNPPSATTSGREELADGEAACFIPRGTGVTNPAVERREASVLRHWTRGASQAPAGLRYWPADGCRCTRAPVGAPLPSHCAMGENGKPRRTHCLARTMLRARVPLLLILILRAEPSARSRASSTRYGEASRRMRPEHGPHGSRRASRSSP